MSFIRLQNVLLNTKYITNIKIYKDSYHINLIGNKLKGMFIFGNGDIYSDNDLYIVSKDKHQEDYDKIDKWISKLE
jgi:hypothetical protein